MSSFTWKRPRDLETQQGRETPQDLETRYEGADIEPASLAAWRLLMEQLISFAGPSRGEYCLLTSATATPMSSGGCKVMRTDRSWPRRTTAQARPRSREFNRNLSNFLLEVTFW
jgi:hypothetical protein